MTVTMSNLYVHFLSHLTLFSRHQDSFYIRNLQIIANKIIKEIFTDVTIELLANLIMNSLGHTEMS